MTTQHFQVRVLLFKDENSPNMWNAQCLEHDIAAQGRTVSAVQKAFAQAFVGQILADVKHGKTPLEGLSEAPQRFWDMFNDDGSRLADVLVFRIPHDIPQTRRISASTLELRVA